MGTIVTAAIALAAILALVAGAVLLFLRVALVRARERVSRERVLVRLRDPRFRYMTNRVLVGIDLAQPGAEQSILWRPEGKARTIRA